MRRKKINKETEINNKTNQIRRQKSKGKGRKSGKILLKKTGPKRLVQKDEFKNTG